MLAGMSSSEKQKFLLTKAEDYHYLTQGNCISCESMDEVEEFSTIRGSMKVCLWSFTIVNSVYRSSSPVIRDPNFCLCSFACNVSLWPIKKIARPYQRTALAKMTLNTLNFQKKLCGRVLEKLSRILRFGSLLYTYQRKIKSHQSPARIG